MLIVGGEDHKTGQANDAEERFEGWKRGRGSVSEIRDVRVSMVGPGHGTC